MQGSLLEDIGAAINRYFAWMASGPRWRFVVGIGGPILVLVLLYELVSGGGDDSPSVASASPTAAVSGSAAARETSPAGTTAPGASTGGATRTTTAAAGATATRTAVAGTPLATVPPGSTYVVRSGDTLGAVCSAVAPSMSSAACVAAIVQLNGLSDPGQLQIGQQLVLPVGTPGVVLTPAPSSTPAPSPAASPAGSPTQPTATATRVP